MPDAPNPYVQHPDYPGLLRAWDATALASLIQCPFKLDQTIIKGWRKPKDAIIFGQFYHSGTEIYDHCEVAGVSKEEAIQRVLRATLATCKAAGWESHDNRRTPYTLCRALAWYADEYYGGTVQPLVLPNGKAATELSFRLPLPLDTPDGEPYILCGHMDRLVNFNGVYVCERKSTASTLSSYYFKQFNPNVQISTYDFAAHAIYDDLLDIKGVMIEACQTGVTFARFHREFCHRTDALRDEFLANVLTAIKDAERYAYEAGKGAAWPKRDSNCMLYGGCDMIPICTKDPGQRDLFLRADFHQEPWNPLETR